PRKNKGADFSPHFLLSTSCRRNSESEYSYSEFLLADRKYGCMNSGPLDSFVDAPFVERAGFRQNLFLAWCCLAAILLFAAALTGCGGGGGSVAASSAPAVTPTPPAPPPPPPPPSITSVSVTQHSGQGTFTITGSNLSHSQTARTHPP